MTGFRGCIPQVKSNFIPCYLNEILIVFPMVRYAGPLQEEITDKYITPEVRAGNVNSAGQDTG